MGRWRTVEVGMTLAFVLVCSIQGRDWEGNG
jgi:hypothetical protein